VEDHLGVTVRKFICIIFALFAPFVLIAKIFSARCEIVESHTRQGQPIQAGLRYLGGIGGLTRE